MSGWNGAAMGRLGLSDEPRSAQELEFCLQELCSLLDLNVDFTVLDGEVDIEDPILTADDALEVAATKQMLDSDLSDEKAIKTVDAWIIVTRAELQDQAILSDFHTLLLVVDKVTSEDVFVCMPYVTEEASAKLEIDFDEALACYPKERIAGILLPEVATVNDALDTIESIVDALAETKRQPKENARDATILAFPVMLPVAVSSQAAASQRSGLTGETPQGVVDLAVQRYNRRGP